MTSADFWLQVKNGIAPVIREHQKHYLRDIHKTKQLHYQQGKVIEEIGEMVQALVAGNFASKSYSSYEDIRGTFESEASDVVIAAISYLLIAGRKLEYAVADLFNNDAEVFLYQCVRTVGDDSFTKLIAIIFAFFEATDRNIAAHVFSRLQFNTHLIMQEQHKEKEVKKLESKKK